MLFALYALLAGIVLGINPLKDQTLTPFDSLVAQPAWSWVDPTVQVKSNQRSDILNALLPHWIEARTQLRSGHLPLWGDTSGGTGLLTPTWSLFTPAFAVFAATPDPATGFLLSVVLNLTIAGLGMHLFLRRRLGLLAAIAGAVAFEFCGFNAAWLYWPHVLTLIWAPWLLWAVDRCSAAPGMRRALPIAVASALVILGGFPFVAVLVFEMAALYALILWALAWRAGERHWRFVGWYAAGTALGIFLCAIPLYEFLVWIGQLDLGYREGRGSYLDWRHASRLLPPWAYEFKRVEQTMYVGAIMTLLAAAALLGALLRWKRLAPLPVFGVALLVIAAGLVFDLWPMWMIGWLPGMSANSWSRAIGILDIAIIVLGALAIDRLWHLDAARRSTWLRAGLVALVAVQCLEVGWFFHRYNGAVDGDYYYPNTPATDYLRRHAGPFDYVIGDDSYRYAGNLGAYGLREWYAHEFPTPALKSALQTMVHAPYVSRTASRIRPQHLKPDSPLMDAFNVRYLAITSTNPDALAGDMPVGAKLDALPSLPEHTWTQHFALERNLVLEGISLPMATHRKSDLLGTVTLTLHDPAGAVLATAAVDAQYMVDNALVDFYFDQPVALAAGRYAFSVAYRPAGVPRRVTTWAWDRPDPDRRLLVDGKPMPAVMDYRLNIVPAGPRGTFQRVLIAADIAVFENTGSPDGPYFIDSLARHPQADSGANVELLEYRPGHFTLRYDGQASGLVVVPMKMTPGWRIARNGVAVDHQLKHGVMPAIAVNGPATLTFTYVPTAAKWLLPWLALLGLALAAMAGADRKLRRQVPS